MTEKNDNFIYIQDAKDEAQNEDTTNLNSPIYNHIGCGPLAMIGQFEYLSSAAGYSSLISDITNNDQKKEMAKEIISETSIVPLGDNGSYCFPYDFIKTACKILEKRSLVNYEWEEPYGLAPIKNYIREGSRIYVYGDSVINTSSKEEKINNIKDSIDKGMPVIWWTAPLVAGGYSSHYMNIYGYEYWQGARGENDVKEHLMFKLRMNWGLENTIVYLDSDLLEYENSGFIYFEEVGNRALIEKEDYDAFSNSYPSNEVSILQITDKTSSVYYTRRLRAGYIGEENENGNIINGQIMISPKKIGEGTAYISYLFNDCVEWLTLDVGWASLNEGINSDNGSVLVQYKDINGYWVTAFDLLNEVTLSTDEENLTTINVFFEEYAQEFRIIAYSIENLDNVDREKLIIGTLNVFFSDHHHFEGYTYYTIYDDIEHFKICDCGVIKYEEHSYDEVFEQYNSSQHKAYCICDDYIIENHTYGHSYESISSSQHHSYCICGSYNVESHVFRVSQVIGGMRKCIGCGYQKFGGGILTLSNEYKVYESLNGSYILNDGTIYLVDEDINSYFDNTLEFYLINNNELI